MPGPWVRVDRLLLARALDLGGSRPDHLRVGFYVRKSLKAGPFRFNLSKSGIGVSAGVPGFRVGSGPRGNYVHMGRGGLYYRATLPSARSGRGHLPAQPAPGVPAPVPAASEVVLHDVTGASVEQLPAVGPSDLVTQLTEAAARTPIAPFAAAVLLVLAVVAGRVGMVLLIVGVPAIVWLGLQDRAHRSVVVFYDVNDAPAQRFQALVDAMHTLASCQRLWFVSAAGQVQTTHQWKANSGAGTIISRKVTRSTMSPPRHLVTNIAVPTLTAGRTSLHLLPDRVLLRDRRRYAEVPYPALLAGAEPQRFIENGPVPSDAQQVDTTWRFVNRNGAPDRRYNNNRQLPVMLYGRLTLTTQQGLHLVFDASVVDATHSVAHALRAASATSTPTPQP